MTLVLTPGAVTIQDLERIWRDGVAVRVDPACHAGIEAAAARIDQIARGNEAVYGVNTGFGKLASVSIPPQDVETLQRNLILSHCCGVGAALDEAIVRLIMSLKLLSLGRGASGVRMEVVTLIEEMLARGVLPVIPEKARSARPAILRRLRIWRRP